MNTTEHTLTDDAVETLELFGFRLVYGRHEDNEVHLADTAGVWVVKSEDLNDAALTSTERTDALSTAPSHYYAATEWWTLINATPETK
jgi:hypothetical protein